MDCAVFFSPWEHNLSLVYPIIHLHFLTLIFDQQLEATSLLNSTGCFHRCTLNFIALMPSASCHTKQSASCFTWVLSFGSSPFRLSSYIQWNSFQDTPLFLETLPGKRIITNRSIRLGNWRRGQLPPRHSKILVNLTSEPSF